MTLTRRRFLTGAAALGAAAFGAAACTSPTTANPGRITLWYTSNGLSEQVLGEAVRRFAADKLTPSQVSGELEQRLLAALAGEAYLPDITMLGDDIASYFADTEHFVDLNTLGAAEAKPEYLPWKWQAGASPDGFQLGFPIDVGPAALYYRHDLFAQAGLPSEPDDVAAAVPTWDDYFDFGVRAQKKLPGRYLITDTKTVFTYSLAQEPRKYFDRDNHYLDDQSQVRRAWDRAVKAFRLGLTAGYAGSQSQNGESIDRHAAWNSGKELSFVNASWISGELKQSAPGTSGKWRVCRAPGGAGNQGGSFLAITKYCPDPHAAFEIVKWLQSPANQPQNYLELGLFPPSPSVYTDPRLLAPEPFFGGQATMEVFSKTAREVQSVYFSPWDITISDTYTDALTTVESAGKDPEQAWNDARASVERLLRRQGVLS
ncbi:extracellular solute-binding protein [Amycolatopsis sp. NBC_01480]|uniref:extracellular solute-binding protein n=1 Tax=Amycolatopsis sp. NBC_01480 TaxID=2903562 RepID=UPI002E27CD33|nr:extracellular solute-binding protein [Amycolatopsis sp. NBC_01480]